MTSFSFLFLKFVSCFVYLGYCIYPKCVHTRKHFSIAWWRKTIHTSDFRRQVIPLEDILFFFTLITFISRRITFASIMYSIVKLWLLIVLKLWKLIINPILLYYDLIRTILPYKFIIFILLSLLFFSLLSSLRSSRSPNCEEDWYLLFMGPAIDADEFSLEFSCEPSSLSVKLV